MKTIMTRWGLIVLTKDELDAALHLGKTITQNRRTWRAKLAFRLAGLLTRLPYTRKLSRLVDHLVVFAEGQR